ncbi:DNA-3-methyladenine glycosylase II [Flavobacterium gossypii]|uniref:DNA-3-methyladenine glycosylase II n=1 Tax=Flavobacterium gossypii TaxID=1646119 RepID=A0ABR6DQL7_9FLAO|nr:DNA-3-methyladenine glycosylase 2 family protein [Flavobacterium gossypii]MBA9073978.1 DNA-3-methyladenine glycosylase II [Flavobacterium gossypii]
MQHPYLLHLSSDPVFNEVLQDAVPRELKKNTNLTLFLYTSIINQQLSAKVGDVIFNRFLALYDGNEPTSQQVLDTPFETLKAIGLSKSKTDYIKNVAQFDVDHGLQYEKLHEMTDDEVSRLVTSIKGIGIWSAQNLLMFGLGREDVFSADDLIIQNTMAALFGLDKSDKKKFKEDMHKLSAQWSP